MRTRNHPVEPEELMAYLDGELPHDRAAATAAHLERCPECQTLAAELREVSRKLMAWPVETPETLNTANLFALVAEKSAEPAGGKMGIRDWWNLIQARRVVWAGGMVAVMAVATVFVISNVQRTRSNRSVMEGYVNSPADRVSSYTAPVPQATPASPAPAVPTRRTPNAGSTATTATYSYDAGGGLISAKKEPEAADTKGDATMRLPAVKPVAVGGSVLDKDGALNDLKKQSSASQTVEVTASAATVEVSPEAGNVTSTNERTEKDEARSYRAKAAGAPAPAAAPPAANQPRPPMIVHEAQLSLVSRDFDQGRAALEEILKRHGGYVGSLNVSAPPGSGRSLNATLRVPAVQLQETLAELKKLGRVTYESQSGEEVTQQYVDLEARLANARNSEQRLKELQRDRTGKLKDVMEVELQIGRTREEIETMEAERKNLGNRVDFATLTVTLAEEYKAELQVVPVSTWRRIGNAAVEGYRTMMEGIVSVVLGLLSVLPSLLLLATTLFFPARWTLKKIKLQRAAV